MSFPDSILLSFGTSPSPPAANVHYDGSPSWADGTVVSSANVEAALDEVVTDLAGTGGAAKIGIVSVVGLTADDVQEALTGLQTNINGKAATSHPHTKANITDFAHTHPTSEVTGLDTVLSTKASTLIDNTFTQMQTMNGGLTVSDVIDLTTVIGAKISPSFTGTNTSRTRIRFNNNVNSSDLGTIIHETGGGNAGDMNKAVVHIMPGDDNSVDDYVTVHGAGMPELIKLFTDGKINCQDLTAFSDARLKTDVIDFEAPARLRPVRFTWLKDGRQDIGFIAQEVEISYPELVYEIDHDGERRKVVSYQKMTVILAARVNALEDRLAKLEARLAIKES